MNAKFYIDRLECKYEDTVVFSAENIEIPRDKLTVILGPSGSGKSTFVEALGLMNKTMTDNSEVHFYSDDDSYSEFVKSKMDKGNGIELNALWSDKNKRKSRKAINEIRHKGYSFVFQDTYLMPNFSAIDNIALTDLIKGNSLAKSYHKIIGGLVKNLHLKNLFFKNKPSEYSGGERQRMAFGRGIFPDFEVLFGDEPTGNLDPHNANEVLKYAKECIKNKPGRSAIIVTHSIDLALQFADKIIVLTPKLNLNGRKMYTVLPEFIFNRVDWENTNAKAQHFREKIDFLINSDNSEVVLKLSEDIETNKLSFDDAIFEKYSSLPNQTNTNQVNVDDLIKKVVCEVPKRKTRNALINEFRVKDSVSINYKGKSDLWDPEKSIFRNVLFLFHRATLWTFKVLIKAEISLLKRIWKNHSNLKSDFLNIFVYNELKEFLGRTFPRNLIFVLFIQFLIFYLIGTANGILDFVAQQDKNPFVKVINITSSYDGIEASMEKVQKEIKVSDYGIDAITYFTQATNHFNPVNEHPDNTTQEEFFDPIDKGKQNHQLISVRSLQPNDPLREYLLKIPALRPTGTDFSGDNDYSVIVTRNFLTRLGQKDSTFIIRSINNAGEKCWQPLPVRGIVDQLPGDADMVCLDNLWASINNDNTWDLASDQLVFWIKMDSVLFTEKFHSLLVNQISSIAISNGIPLETKNSYDPILFDTVRNVVVKPIENIQDLFEVRISSPGISKSNKDLIFGLLMRDNSIVNFLKDNNIPLERMQLSYLNTLASGGEVKYNDANLSVNSFKHIYEFSEKVYQISGIRLDMGKIERIRTYRIVASVTVMLSSFLIVFSILIITILLSNILSNHLNKIKKNIGLLMAFGVSTKVIYQCIMGTFIFVTLIGGAALSYILGDLFHFNKYIFESSTGFVLPDFSGFKLSWAYISDSHLIYKFITNPTLITIVLMMGFNLIRFNFIINQIFKETPGNLIYDKSNKG